MVDRLAQKIAATRLEKVNGRPPTFSAIKILELASFRNQERETFRFETTTSFGGVYSCVCVACTTVINQDVHYQRASSSHGVR
jgi:hypothetical protein